MKTIRSKYAINQICKTAHNKLQIYLNMQNGVVKMHIYSNMQLNVLLFKIQVKKRKNGRREDPVICGSGNLKATSSRAKIIFTFDLNSF